jgi:hypothetical protein
MNYEVRFLILNSYFSLAGRHRSTANPRVNQLIICGYAVKTLESKETKAPKKITLTHNSVFAAHRLQCRMTIRKIDIRHFAFSGSSVLKRRGRAYFSSRETCPAASCHRPSRLINVSVNCTMRSNGLPSAVPFTRVFPRTTAILSPYSRAIMS